MLARRPEDKICLGGDTMGEKAIFFSPTGGVKKVAEILCNNLFDFTFSIFLFLLCISTLILRRLFPSHLPFLTFLAPTSDF